METNTYYYAGIDIGSTTVKLVLLNEAGEMVWGEYRRHCAHTQETLAEMMREARKKLGACRVKVRMTGSGAISLAEALRVGFVQEVVAVADSAAEGRAADRRRHRTGRRGREDYLFHRRIGRAHERRVRGRHRRLLSTRWRRC